MKNKSPKITKDLALKFFDALDANEEFMGENAAIAVTLEQLGFASDDIDAYIKLFQAHPECKMVSPK